jgi:hypothetical protein
MSLNVAKKLQYSETARLEAIPSFVPNRLLDAAGVRLGARFGVAHAFPIEHESTPRNWNGCSGASPYQASASAHDGKIFLRQ